MEVVKVNNSYGAEVCANKCGRLADMSLANMSREIGERARLRLCVTCAAALAVEMAAKLEELEVEGCHTDRPATLFSSDQAAALGHSFARAWNAKAKPPDQTSNPKTSDPKFRPRPQPEGRARDDEKARLLARFKGEPFKVKR
jgi:hypothetical protein